MAYVDPNQITPAVQSQPGAPVPAGGAGLGGAQTQPSSAKPGVNVPNAPSAALSDYLKSNSEQSGTLGSNVASGITAQNNAVSNAIQPAVNTYTGQLYTVPTDNAVNQTVATTPSALTPDQISTYNTELAASSKAPNSAKTFETTQPYANLVSQIQGAVDQANLWSSGNNVASVSTALQPFESSGATSGDTTLDALLLSNTPSAYNQITAASAPALNFNAALGNAASQADQALRAAIAQDQAATTAAQAAPQTYAGNLTSYLKNAVNQSTNNDQKLSAKIMSDISSNTPTQQDLDTLGVTQDQWATLSQEVAAAKGTPFKLSDYLTQAGPNASMANEASPTQYADVSMLQSILGGNAPVLPIDPTTAAQAGTASTPTTENQLNLIGAEANAQLAPLAKAAKDIQAQGAYANKQYGIDHFGGQTPDQFNQYIAKLNAQLHAINSKIKALSAEFPQFSEASSVNGPGGSNYLTNALKEAPLVGLASFIPGVQDIVSSVGKDIGRFFGFSEGGEVKKRNLKEYLGATQ